MTVINTAAFAKALKPGLRRIFGDYYKEIPLQCSQIFEMLKSDEAYEEELEATGFGYGSQKGETESILYDTVSQQAIAKFTHATIALGYIISLEAIEDNKYPKLSKSYSRNLAFSMRQTKEVLAAEVLNNAFSSGSPIYDSQALISASHPSQAGNQSNLLTAGDLNEAAVEDGYTTVRKMTNNRGLQINLRVQKLIVPPDLEFKARRIMTASRQSGTANNDPNVLKDMNAVPEGIFVYDYLDDPNAWFLQTNSPTGLVGFQRIPLSFTDDNEHDTTNMKFAARERYVFGSSDFRGIVGNAGPS